jgi:hypothetical protein
MDPFGFAASLLHGRDPAVALHLVSSLERADHPIVLLKSDFCLEEWAVAAPGKD